MTPPVEGALFRAAFVASCLRGAFPPVDLRAVCFVRAIFPHLPTETGTRDTGARLSPGHPPGPTTQRPMPSSPKCPPPPPRAGSQRPPPGRGGVTVTPPPPPRGPAAPLPGESGLSHAASSFLPGRCRVGGRCHGGGMGTGRDSGHVGKARPVRRAPGESKAANGQTATPPASERVRCPVLTGRKRRKRRCR